MRIKHGHARTGKKSSYYHIWINKIQICTNPRNKDYPNYGGRGITVWGPWLHSFPRFLEDVLAQIRPRPNGKYDLDRINNDGNYETENIRWAPKSLSDHNRRTWAKSGSQGLRQTRNGSWQARIDIDGHQLCLGTFARKEDAIAQRRTFAMAYYGDGLIYTPFATCADAEAAMKNFPRFSWEDVLRGRKK